VSQLTPATRPRSRRRLRLLPILGYAVGALGLAWFFELQATTTVIFVRHADLEPGVALDSDPSLSAAGRERAERLADFLQDVDVVQSVDYIFMSPMKRTQETAAPLAQRLGIKTEITDESLVEHFVRRVLRRHKGEITLIVADAEAIPPLIDELHGSKRLPPFAPDDYDELYIVTIPWYGKVKTLRLHYGQQPTPRLEFSEGATSTLTAPR
jgi:broad specificity phosphatase PhoE